MTFNYESKLWGASKVTTTPFYLGALRLRYVLSALGAVRGNVLEIGCGGGGMIKAIKSYRPDITATGCDISRDAIAVAKKNPEGVNFVVGDIYKLPFPTEHFDAVVVFDVLEHIDNPTKGMAEISRVLKKRGTFHGYVPCEGGMLTYTHWLYLLGWQGKERYAGHIQRLTGKQCIRILHKTNFRITRVAWSGHFFYQLVDMLYFLWLTIRGENVSGSVETIVSRKKKKSLFLLAVSAIVKLVALGTFLESSMSFGIPGIGMHITARKENAS